jgi:hypothetical protein
MKHLIVQTVEKLSIALVCLVLFVGLISGYTDNGVGGAILGLVGAFLFSVFFFGILFILLEMNESLRSIRQQLSKADEKPSERLSVAD